MAFGFKLPVNTRAPKPLASIAYLLLLAAVLLLFIGRSTGALRFDPILDLAPEFYTHVSNFSISYLLCTAIGYQWLMAGSGMKSILLLALAIMLGNIVYEGFIPVINTPDPVDGYYGLVGTALGLVVLIVLDRYGLRAKPAPV